MEKKYDWNQIQEDYNRGLTQRELTGKYGVSIVALYKANKRGDVTFRSRAEALRLASIKVIKACQEKTNR